MDNSPAKVLRDAATRIRELAEMTPDDGAWTAGRVWCKWNSPLTPDGWWWEVADDAGSLALLSEQDDIEGTTAEGRARWIVAMSPAVFEPLAAWLEHEAECLDQWRSVDALARGLGERSNPGRDSALAFARTVLGGVS